MPEPNRVRGNDWRTLSPARLGAWQPVRTVSLVVPAHQASRTLAHTLAGLSVQTYPADLMEVVVVDDGSEPALTLPEVRPERTRLVRTSGSWGRAHACHVGALAAEGEVVHWLDADMLLHRDEVEAQMRWHHLIDHAVVLGRKTFIDLAEGLPSVDETLAAVREGRTDELFAGRWTAPHDWVEEHLERTHQLVSNPTMSYLVHVGATASVARDLYLESGGMDPDLKLGEDVELGYRLAQLGAVFVPDDEARSWHLGRSTLMDQQQAVNRYNRPFVTDRVANLRSWRTKGVSYTVPWVEAVVTVGTHTFEQVRHTVVGLLTGSTSDLVVLVVGPWSGLADDRRSPLADPDQDLRMLLAEFRGEARVRFLDEAPPSAFPATYRMQVPPGWAPGRDTVRRLGREMARRDLGLISLLLPDGRVSRLERTSAFHRARRIAGPGAVGHELEDVVAEVSGTWWYEAVEEGFTALATDEPDATATEPTPSSTAPEPTPTPTAAPTAAPTAPPTAPPTVRAPRRLLHRLLGRGS